MLWKPTINGIVPFFTGEIDATASSATPALCPRSCSELRRIEGLGWLHESRPCQRAPWRSRMFGWCGVPDEPWLTRPKQRICESVKRPSDVFREQQRSFRSPRGWSTSLSNVPTLPGLEVVTWCLPLKRCAWTPPYDESELCGPID